MPNSQADILIDIAANISQYTKDVKDIKNLTALVQKDIGKTGLAIAKRLAKEKKAISAKEIKEMGAQWKLWEKERISMVRGANAKIDALHDKSLKKQTSDLKEAILKREKIKQKEARKSLNTQRRIARSEVLQSLKDQRKASERHHAIELAKWKRYLANKARAERKAAATAAASATTGSSTTGGQRHLTLSESVKIVAKYGLISQALYAIQTAMRSVVTELVNFDNILYANQAILNKTAIESKKLISTVKELGIAYGGSFADIQAGLITLGRAGVDSTSDLQGAVKVLKELSLITGDSMSDGAEIMSSLINVYGKEAGFNIKNVGDQLAYVANETRLGIADFSTLSNYALTSAKALGLTKEAFFALSGSMSKVGLNASTIGTSIRRLQKLTQDGTAANAEFFRIVGLEQEEFSAKLLEGGKASDEALAQFIERLGQMSKGDYLKAVKDLPVLLKQSVNAYRQIGQADYFNTMVFTLDKANGKLKKLGDQAAIMSVGFGVAMERIANQLTVSMGAVITDTNKAVDGFGGFNEVSLRRLNDEINFVAKNLGYLAEAMIKTLALPKTLAEKGSNYVADLFFGKEGAKEIIITMASLEKEYAALEAKLEKEENTSSFMGLDKEYVKELITEMSKIEDKMIDFEAAAKRVRKAAYDAGGSQLKELSIGYSSTQIESLQKAEVELSKLVGTFNKLKSLGTTTKNTFKAFENAAKVFTESGGGAKQFKALMAAQVKYIKAYGKEQEAVTKLKLKDFAVTQKQVALDDAALKLSREASYLTRTITQEEIAVREARTAIREETEALAALETQRGEVLKNAKDNDEDSLKIAEQQVIISQQKNVIAAKQNDLTAALNRKMLTFITNITKARNMGLELARVLRDANNALANTNIDGRVSSGELSVDQGEMLKNNIRLKSVAEGRLAVMTKLRGINADLAKTDKDNLLTTSQRKDKIQKFKVLSADLTRLATERKTIEQSSLTISRAAGKSEVERAVVAQKRAIMDAENLRRYATKKETTQGRKGAESDAFKADITATKKLLSMSTTKANIELYTNQLADQRSKLLAKESDIAKGLLVTAKKKKDTGAADARAALKLSADALSLLAVEAEIKKANLELEYEKNGLVMSEYATHMANAEMYAAQAAVAKEAYDTAVAKHGLHNANYIIQKKILALELKSVKANIKVWKEKNKYVKDFQKSMNGVADSFSNSLLSGDLKGAFKSLQKDIVKVFVKPLKDSFSELFGKTMKALFGGFYDGLMQKSAEMATTEIATIAEIASVKTAANAVETTEMGLLGMLKAKIAVIGASIGVGPTGFVTMAAMAAAMAAIGFAVSGGGGGAGGATKESHSKANNIAMEAESTGINDFLGNIDKTLLKGLKYSSRMVDSLEALVFESIKTARALSIGYDSSDKSYEKEGTNWTKKDVKVTSLENTLNLDWGLDGLRAWTREVTQTERSGMFSTDRNTHYQIEGIEADIYNGLVKSYEAGFKAITDGAGALGISWAEDAIANFNPNEHNLDIMDKDSAGIQEMIAGAVGEDLNNLLKNDIATWIDGFALAGEEAIETFGRLTVQTEYLTTQLPLVGQAFELWGNGSKHIVDEAVRLGNVMITAAGGLDAFASAMDSFKGSFYTTAENLAMSTTLMQTEFNKLDEEFSEFTVTMPTTNEGFRELMEGINLNTEAGAKLYGQLLPLAEGFDEITQSTKELTNSYNEVVYTIEQNLQMALGDMADKFHELGLVLPSTTQEFRYMVDSAEAMGNADLANTLRGLAEEFDATVGAVNRTIASLKEAQAAYTDPVQVTRGGISTATDNFMTVGNDGVSGMIDKWAQQEIAAANARAAARAKANSAYIASQNKIISANNALRTSILSMKDSVYKSFRALLSFSTEQQLGTLQSTIASKNYKDVPAAFNAYAKGLSATSGSQEEFYRGIIDANAMVQGISTPSYREQMVASTMATSASAAEIAAINSEAHAMYQRLIEQNEKMLVDDALRDVIESDYRKFDIGAALDTMSTLAEGNNIATSLLGVMRNLLNAQNESNTMQSESNTINRSNRTAIGYNAFDAIMNFEGIQ